MAENRNREPDELDLPEPGAEPGPSSRPHRKKGPSAFFIFLIIFILGLLIMGMGQSLGGGGDLKQVSWGEFRKQLENRFRRMSDERLAELRDRLEKIPGLTAGSRRRLLGILVDLPADPATTVEEQDRWLRSRITAMSDLTREQRKAARKAIGEITARARQDLERGRMVEKILIEDDQITAVLKGEYKVRDRGYKRIRAEIPAQLAQSPELERELIAAVADRKNVEYRTPSKFGDILIQLVPLVLIFLLIYFFFVRSMRSAAGPGSFLNFGRSRARLITPDRVKTTFDDVAGIDEAKSDVRELVEFLKHPKKFQRLGGRIPRGILLVGPPGTGKTLLAKAIAGEAGVPFFSISGSDFVEMFVGVGAGRVRDLFRQAREQAPCVVFLDEIDAVGRRRGSGLGGGHDEREQTLNQILVEMDGFGTHESVIVLAATNRPDILDPALLRPGRFDRQIVIDLPDLEGREAILKVHAKKVRLAKEVDLSVIARTTAGCSGADLAAIINEAAIIATMRNRYEVTGEDLEEARDKTMFGREKRSRVLDEKEKSATAYHESGHAVVAQLLVPASEPVHKVTIVPRGLSLGSTMQLPDRDRHILPRSYFLARLAVLYGGRASEEIFLKDVSSGAKDDIKKATEIARSMVTEWGMSEVIGPIFYSESEEHIFLGREITRHRTHSEETAHKIDQEVRRLLEEAYRKAKDLITRNRDKVKLLAEALLRYETLSGDEIVRILQGEDITTVRAQVKARPAGASRE